MNKLILAIILILITISLIAFPGSAIIRITNNMTGISGGFGNFSNITVVSNITLGNNIIIKPGYGLYINSTVYSIYNGSCWITRANNTYSYTGC